MATLARTSSTLYKEFSIPLHCHFLLHTLCLYLKVNKYLDPTYSHNIVNLISSNLFDSTVQDIYTPKRHTHQKYHPLLLWPTTLWYSNMDQSSQKCNASHGASPDDHSANTKQIILRVSKVITIFEEKSGGNNTTTRKSLLQDFPVELLVLIYDSVEYHMDMLCLGLTCKLLWTVYQQEYHGPISARHYYHGLNDRYQNSDGTMTTLGCRLVRNIASTACPHSTTYNAYNDDTSNWLLTTEWIESHSGGWAGSNVTYHPSYRTTRGPACFINKQNLMAVASLTQKYGWVSHS